MSSIKDLKREKLWTSLAEKFSEMMQDETKIEWFVGYETHDNVNFSFYLISENDFLAVWSLTRNRIEEKYHSLDRFAEDEIAMLATSWKERQQLMETFPEDWGPFRKSIAKVYEIAKAGRFHWQSQEVKEAWRDFREVCP